MSARLSERQIIVVDEFDGFTEVALDISRTEAEQIAKEQGWHIETVNWGDGTVETDAFRDPDDQNSPLLICVDGCPASFYSQ